MEQELSFQERLRLARRAALAGPKPIMVSKPAEPKPPGVKIPAARKPSARAKRKADTTREPVNPNLQSQKKRVVREESRTVYKTRKLDLSNKVPFQIDHKTTVYIDPDADREKILDKYNNRHKFTEDKRMEERMRSQNE